MIKGTWYPKYSAAQYGATLSIQGDSFVVVREGQPPIHGKITSLSFSDRLAKTQRKITLDDGSVFLTKDNESIDQLLVSHGQSKYMLWLHWLESRLVIVFFAFFIVIASYFSFAIWGLPWVSEKIAHALPHKVNEKIGLHSFSLIDEYFFEDSELSEDRKQAIRKRFELKLLPLLSESDVNYRLHFRQWQMNDVAIPNALALPSGDLILTDKFVELSQNSDEIDAVLLHEMGHVVHRHGLTSIVQSSLTTALVLMIFGNTDGVSDLATGFVTALISSNYSREHEAEADHYAFENMLLVRIDPNAFARILNRMESYANMQFDEEQEITQTDDSNRDPTQSTEQQKKTVLDYLSSHPSTHSRSLQAKYYHQCFVKGLTYCPPQNEND